MRRESDLHSIVWTVLTLATGPACRARGLLLEGVGDTMLLLVPCNDIHTVGMRECIDVAFVDRAGQVIETHRSVRPFRRLRNRKAAAVVERFSSCQASWFETGDRLAVSAFPKEGVTG